MADSSIAVTPGAGATIDTRTEGTNSEHRQVVVVGDPATNAGVAPVDATNGLTVNAAAGATSIGANEDDAHVSADRGVKMLVKRGDTPADTSGTDGDYEFLQISGGLLWTRNVQKFVTVSVDITRPADTTLYTANDAWAATTPAVGGSTFANAVRASGGSGMITDAIFATAADAATLLSGELWLFDSAITAVSDNAAFVVSDTEIKAYIGKIGFQMEDAGNNGACMVPNSVARLHVRRLARFARTDESEKRLHAGFRRSAHDAA